MLVSNEEARELGVSPFGDHTAPVVDRVIATFANKVAVLDERVTSLKPQTAQAVTSHEVYVDFGSVEGDIATA